MKDTPGLMKAALRSMEVVLQINKRGIQINEGHTQINKGSIRSIKSESLEMDLSINS